MRVGQLWIQEKSETEELRYRKVKGTENPADILTKSLPSTTIHKYLQEVGIDTRTGRAESSLELTC